MSSDFTPWGLLTDDLDGEFVPWGPLFSPSAGGGVVEVEGDAEDAIVFTEDAVGDLFALQTPSESLSLVEDAGVLVVRVRAASESLVIGEIVGGATLSQFVSESLTFVEEADKALQLNVSEGLVFTELMLRVFTYGATETLSLAEAADSDRILRVFESLDALVEAVVRTRLHDEDLAESLTFSEQIRRRIDVALAEELTLVEVLNRIKLGVISETLDLAEDADVDAIKAILEEIEFEEVVSQAGSIFVRAVVEEVELDEVVAWSFIGGDSPCLETYDPGISTRTGLRLTYPYDTPTTTLDLRVPKFGNSQQVTKNVKIRRTITGQLRIAQSSTWPVIDELQMSFEALTRTQRDAVLSFVEEASGQEIGLLDHEDRQWRGIILSPNVSVAQEGRSDCDYSASFTFRGRIA